MDPFTLILLAAGVGLFALANKKARPGGALPNPSGIPDWMLPRRYEQNPTRWGEVISLDNGNDYNARMADEAARVMKAKELVQGQRTPGTSGGGILGAVGGGTAGFSLGNKAGPWGAVIGAAGGVIASLVSDAIGAGNRLHVADWAYYWLQLGQDETVNSRLIHMVMRNVTEARWNPSWTFGGGRSDQIPPIFGQPGDAFAKANLPTEWQGWLSSDKINGSWHTHEGPFPDEVIRLMPLWRDAWCPSPSDFPPNGTDQAAVLEFAQYPIYGWDRLNWLKLRAGQTDVYVEDFKAYLIANKIPVPTPKSIPLTPTQKASIAQLAATPVGEIPVDYTVRSPPTQKTPPTALGGGKKIIE